MSRTGARTPRATACGASSPVHAHVPSRWPRTPCGAGVARVASIGALAACIVHATGCHLLSGVTPCPNGEACPSGEVCDPDVGVCVDKPAPQPPAPKAGTCEAPRPLTLGVPLALDTRDAETEQVSGTCPGAGGLGPDAAFVLDPPSDGRVRVQVEVGAAFDVQLYARPTCDEPLTELACRDDVLDGLPEELELDVTAHVPVFFIVDGFAGADAGPITVLVQQVVPAGAACVLAGEPDPARLCDFGTSCVAGTCAHVDLADRCDTAIRLLGKGGVVQGDTRGALDDDEADGTCNATTDFPEGFVMDGRDVFYVVTVAAGQVLTLHLESPFADLSLALQVDCPSPADGSCLQFADTYPIGVAEDLVFTNAGGPGDVFIVVDGYEPTEYGAFTLRWSLPP
jgi:hypothetical protein